MGRLASSGIGAGDAKRVAGSSALRQRRQVSDDILIAFHFACDLKDLVIAQKLLQALEALIAAHGETLDANRQRAIATLVAAHERLWNLRMAEAEAALPLGDQPLTLHANRAAMPSALSTRFGLVRS